MKMTTIDYLEYVENAYKKINNSKEYVTNLDSELGDGDHWININMGLEAVVEKKENLKNLTIKDLLKNIGMILMTKIGGSSGVLYGSSYINAAKNLEEIEVIDIEALYSIMNYQLLGMMERGNTEYGDKTMVDPLYLAVEEFKREKENIKSVVAGPLTGDNAEYGNGFKNAAELKIKEYNENGGVLGKQVILETYDDKNTGEEGATIAQKISSDSDVVAVIGHFSSGVSMVAAPTYDENKIIQISPSASHPDYASLGKYIFRNNTVINIEAEEGVKLATQVLNGKKIGLLSIRTDWGTSTAEITKELIKKYGATLVGHEEVVEGSDDYLPNVTKLNDAGAEVVIVAGMYNTLM